MATAMLAGLWDRIVASDPGLTRLASATRVTASVAVAVAVLVGLATRFGVPVTVALLGAVVAMNTALSVNDPEPRTTTLLVTIPGTLGIVLGALVGSRPLLADITFLVVLFAAVAVRRYGQRWTALGTIGTMTYFVALFLGATVDQLPALIAAIAVAVAVTFLVRFVVLRDPPGWTARRTVEAFRARIRLLISAARDALEAPNERRAHDELDAAASRLNETARALESRLADDASDVARAIFNAELAAENVATAALRVRHEQMRPRALRLALEALSNGKTARATRLALKLRDDPGASPAVRELAASIADLGDALRGLGDLAVDVAASSGNVDAAAPPQQPPLRQALQVTLAAAAAIAVGEALSPQRWYWAVLATYFVFIGTASSGETLDRAWSRTLGTALGVTMGMLVGHLALGHTTIEAALMAVCLFLGVYTLRVSQTAMIFFITALLALAWGMLGRFSDGLLVVRLEETAIGAAFGALAAMVVMPTRTRDVIRDALRETLEAAAAAVHASVEHLAADGAADQRPVAAARELDGRFQTFLDRTRPIASHPRLARRGSALRRQIITLSAVALYARNLAALAERAAHTLTPGAADALHRLDEAVTANVHAVARRFDGEDAPVVDIAPLLEGIFRFEGAGDPESLEAAVRQIEKLDRAVVRLAQNQRPASSDRAVATASDKEPVLAGVNERRSRPGD